MTAANSQSPIREAVGVFFDAESVEGCVNNLKSNGFSNEHIGLLANQHTVQAKLTHLYEEVNKHGANEPDVAFVGKESTENSTSAFLGSLSFIGAATVGSGMVASAALLGGPLLVSAATVAFGGGITAVMGWVISKSEADYLEEQIEAGHILLFVRTRNAQQERKALDSFSKFAAFGSKIVTIDGSTAEKGFSPEH